MIHLIPKNILLDVKSVLTMNEAILNSLCPTCLRPKFKMAVQLFKYGVLRIIQYLLHSNKENGQKIDEVAITFG